LPSLPLSPSASRQRNPHMALGKLPTASEKFPTAKTCLESWAAGGEPDGCAGQSATRAKDDVANLSLVSEPRLDGPSQVIDSNASTFTVKVSTTFHDFSIQNISVTGSNEAPEAKKDSVLRILLGLNSLDAGIDARTVHAKKWLDVGRFPVIDVEVEWSTKFPPRSMTVNEVWTKVQVRGISRRIKIAITCTEGLRSCDLLPRKVNLELWDLNLPSFLGIKVNPVIEVSGRIMVRSNG
jgi:polyisoprenoid-binding protein YceI